MAASYVEAVRKVRCSDERFKSITIFLLGAVFGIALATSSFFGSPKAAYNDGNGASAVREQLEQTQKHQSDITERVKGAEEQLGAVKNRVEHGEAAVGTASGRADELETNLRSAAGIIEDCQRILGEIRRRGEGETK